MAPTSPSDINCCTYCIEFEPPFSSSKNHSPIFFLREVQEACDQQMRMRILEVVISEEQKSRRVLAELGQGVGQQKLVSVK